MKTPLTTPLSRAWVACAFITSLGASALLAVLTGSGEAPSPPTVAPAAQMGAARKRVQPAGQVEAERLLAAQTEVIALRDQMQALQADYRALQDNFVDQQKEAEGKTRERDAALLTAGQEAHTVRVMQTQVAQVQTKSQVELDQLQNAAIQWQDAGQRSQENEQRAKQETTEAVTYAKNAETFAKQAGEEVEWLREQLQGKQQELTSKEYELSVCCQEKSHLQTEVSRLRSANAHLAQCVSSLQCEVSRLKGELETAKRQTSH